MNKKHESPSATDDIEIEDAEYKEHEWEGSSLERPDTRVMDAGRKRLDDIKRGFRSFTARAIRGFKGAGKSAGKGIETGVVAALSAPEAAASAGRAVKGGAEAAAQRIPARGAGASRSGQRDPRAPQTGRVHHFAGDARTAR